MPSTPAHESPAAALTRRQVERTLAHMLVALPDDARAFLRLCDEVTDWDALYDWAHRHGVAGVLHSSLTGIEYPLPLAVKERADRQRAAEQLAQWPLHRALDEALEALDTAGLPTAALKGPVLGERLYPDPSVRVSSDLDFLLVPGDVDRAAAALETIGYRCDNGPDAAYLREHHQQVSLLRPRSPCIELHAAAYSGFGTAVAAEPLLERACRYRTGRGFPCWLLAPEDELLHLALHAAGHRFEQWMWLYDLKLFVRRYPELDWSLVAARAQALQSVNALGLTLEILDRFGVPIPRGGSFPTPGPLRRHAALWLVRTTATHPLASQRGLLGWYALQAILCDHSASAARFLGRHFRRFFRRRAQRLFPGWVPKEWAN